MWPLNWLYVIRQNNWSDFIFLLLSPPPHGSKNSSVFTTIWLPLTASSCHILPYFAFSVTESQIINNFLCPAHRRRPLWKSRQNGAEYGFLGGWTHLTKILFVCHGRTFDKWAGCDKVSQIAANCGNSWYKLLPFYYRSEDWKPYMWNIKSAVPEWLVPVLPLTVLALLVLRLFNWLIFGKVRHIGRSEREGHAGALHRVRWETIGRAGGQHNDVQQGPDRVPAEARNGGWSPSGMEQPCRMRQPDRFAFRSQIFSLRMTDGASIIKIFREHEQIHIFRIT